MAQQQNAEQTTALIASKATSWLQKNISDGVIKPLNGYDLGAEISSAMLMIAQTSDRNGRPALQVCSQESIVSALRDMAIQGLSMVRKQCYPIVYGSQLQIQRSYFGTLSVFSRMFPNLKATANVVYMGDEYEYCYDEFGDFNYIVLKGTKLENRDKPIMAAFGSIFDSATGKRVYGCVMSRSEIDKCWAKAKTHNVQNDFPQEMAKRTLFNRMCKLYVNSSTSIEPILADAYNRTTQNEYEDETPRAPQPSEVGKAIRSKSQGASGLETLLKAKESAESAEPKDTGAEAEPQKKPVERSEEEKQEFTPPSEENASKPQDLPPSGTSEDDGDMLFDSGDIPEDENSYMEIPF